MTIPFHRHLNEAVVAQPEVQGLARIFNRLVAYVLASAVVPSSAGVLVDIEEHQEPTAGCESAAYHCQFRCRPRHRCGSL